MKKIPKIAEQLKRNAYLAMSGHVLLFLMLSTLVTGQATAGQLINRFVQSSDSAVSGGSITTGVGSGTNVGMRIEFDRASTANVGGIVIDFCSNSALMFDTCTAPAGFNTNWATTQIYNQVNLGTTFSVFTTAGGQQVNNRIVITRGSPAALGTNNSTFELGNGTANGMTNPSATGAFFARIYTYNTAANAQSHVAATSNANYVDFGAVAMATTSVIQITARVQENLMFCVSAASPTSNCGGTSAPAIAIGHGTPKIIDSTAVDTGVVYSQLSTNAQSGASVRIRTGNGSCGGLSTDGGTTCSIPPIFAGASTAPAAAMTAGTAAFGLTVAAGSGGLGSISPVAPYANVTANYYGMDATSSGTNVTSTFGSKVMESIAPVSNVNNTWTFAATASNVTPAGLYAANMAVIATGNF